MAELSFTYAVRPMPRRGSLLVRASAALSGLRQVIVSDHRMWLPRGDFSRTMIEVDPADVRHVRLDDHADHRTAIVSTESTTVRLRSVHFDGEVAFEDCLEAIMRAAQAARRPRHAGA